MNVMKCSVCQTELISRYPHIEPSGLAHSEAICLDVVVEQRDAEEMARKMLAADCAKYSTEVIDLRAKLDEARETSVGGYWHGRFRHEETLREAAEDQRDVNLEVVASLRVKLKATCEALEWYANGHRFESECDALSTDAGALAAETLAAIGEVP